MARNRNGEIYVVCNYNPAGNFLGSFMDNVLPLIGDSPRKSLFSAKLIQTPIDEIAWQQEALLIHNEYRRRHRVADLILSVELTAAAKVNTMKKKKKSCYTYILCICKFFRLGHIHC